MITVRLTKPLRHAEGVQYMNGEVLTVNEARGRDYITRGWAVEVAEPPAGPSPPAPQPGKDLRQSPADKMIRGPGKAK